MASPNRRVIMGQEITRAGNAWTWEYGPSTWMWENKGDGGTVRPSDPRLVAADVGQWCDNLEQAAIWVAGFCEGYEAAKLPAGGRLTASHAPPAAPPAEPPPAVPHVNRHTFPPVATPVNPPKGGAS